MYNDNPNETLLGIITKLVPQKNILVNLLTDLLAIEKEAVYRRLRGEVPFSFAEVVKISKTFNFSIDHLIKPNTNRKYPFQLQLTRHFDPEKIDYDMHEEFIAIIESIQSNLNSEIGYASGILPLHFSIKHEYLHRFYALRSLYQFGNPGTTLAFCDIFFTDKMKEIFYRFLKSVELFKNTCFIFDRSAIKNLVNDILYFNSIRLITDSELKEFKTDIAGFLDDLEEFAMQGKYNNGNIVDIYVSNLNFEASYSYMQINSYKISLLKAFTLAEVASLEGEVFDKMHKWFQGLKRTSTLISGSDERSRILFLDEQREYLDREL